MVAKHQLQATHTMVNRDNNSGDITMQDNNTIAAEHHRHGIGSAGAEQATCGRAQQGQKQATPTGTGACGRRGLPRARPGADES